MPGNGASRRRSSRSSRRTTPPPPLAEPQLITERSDLLAICERIKAHGSFAFDTEFVMEDRFRPEVCLMQLALEDVVAVVDPYEVGDLDPVWALVGDPEVEVIVHAGMEDLALCQNQGGHTPQQVFDCQIACGLVTPDYPLSLSRMARAVLNVRLHKSQTLTDWRRRPLSAAQLRYAADDVVYLPAIRADLGGRLQRTGRVDWMAEEMSKFSDPSTYARGAEDNIFKLKGAGALSGLGLAIARELVKVRQALANQYDRPARAVVRDHLLIEIAKHQWSNPAEIKTLRGLSLRASALQELADAVQRARALPPDQWPMPAAPNDETEHEACLAMLAGAVIRAFCTQEGISHQLVGAKKDVQMLVQAHVRGDDRADHLPLANGWRAQTVGAAVRDVLSGRSRIAVVQSKQGPKVVIE